MLGTGKPRSNSSTLTNGLAALCFSSRDCTARIIGSIAIARRSKFGESPHSETVPRRGAPCRHNSSKRAEHPRQAARRAGCQAPLVSPQCPILVQPKGCLPGTELVLTLTTGMRQLVEKNSTVRLVKARLKNLRSFSFLMVWHPRLTTNPPPGYAKQCARQRARVTCKVAPQEASAAPLRNASTLTQPVDFPTRPHPRADPSKTQANQS